MKWIERLREAADPDRALQAAMSALLDAAANRYAMGREGSVWKPGTPLRILLAGYAGTRNTGADVRVEEMIRQFRHILSDDQVELSIFTTDRALSAGYFRNVHQIELPVVFPLFLYEECTRHHGVISCEGSMFKSKFAEALSTMMAGALGMANVEGKLSIGYGAEAGGMSENLERFVRRHCRDSLVICRNEPSRAVLGALGIRTTSGTDTAWTFEPAPPHVGEAKLRAAGWDGAQPILAVCPINPFWWPVRPDLVKAAARELVGEFEREHYKSIYFHDKSEENDLLYEQYLDGLAFAVNTFAREQGVFPILVGMEKLDRRACEHLAPRLEREAPLFVSDDHDMYTMVSVLHRCTYMVSSRFHAIVTSMPGGVASCGVTMDERIRNLMNDRGHESLYIEVDDDDLGENTLAMLRHLAENLDEIRADIERTIPRELVKMGQMGIEFSDEVRRVYPEFPMPERRRTWYDHLPPLSPALKTLVEKHL
jgi:polysaccharide pyruvyl transferase WcaK-like protein